MKTKDKQRGEHRYVCSKCGEIFWIQHELTEDARPVCNDCFGEVVKAKTYNDYLLSIMPEL